MRLSRTNRSYGTIAGLLGASPGASTAVPAMLDVMERCFGDRYKSWLPKLKEIVPSLGTELSGEPALFEEVWSWGTKVLKLDRPASGVPAAAAMAGCWLTRTEASSVQPGMRSFKANALPPHSSSRMRTSRPSPSTASCTWKCG